MAIIGKNDTIDAFSARPNFLKLPSNPENNGFNSFNGFNNPPNTLPNSFTALIGPISPSTNADPTSAIGVGTYSSTKLPTPSEALWNTPGCSSPLLPNTSLWSAAFCLSSSNFSVFCNISCFLLA